MSDPILIARGIRKTYKSGDRKIGVLAGVDFTLAAGESASIRGESGSGKSTLLNVLAGLDKPEAGTVDWAGFKEVNHAARAQFLGIIFQAFYLIPELTAVENVLMARRIAGPVTAAHRERARFLIEKVGLGERATHVPSQLSGGERQRVAVARALMNQPKLILADEPTGNLDEATGEAVVEILLKLCQEMQTGLVLVTHNAQHAARASRQYHLIQGVLHVV